NVEREPEVEPGRRLGDGQVALDLVRHRQVALAPELEGLQLDRNGVALLLSGAKAEATERVAGHRTPLEVTVVVFRLSGPHFRGADARNARLLRALVQPLAAALDRRQELVEVDLECREDAVRPVLH